MAAVNPHSRSPFLFNSFGHQCVSSAISTAVAQHNTRGRGVGPIWVWVAGNTCEGRPPDCPVSSGTGPVQRRHRISVVTAERSATACFECHFRIQGLVSKRVCLLEGPIHEPNRFAAKFRSKPGEKGRAGCRGNTVKPQCKHLVCRSKTIQLFKHPLII